MWKNKSVIALLLSASLLMACTLTVSAGSELIGPEEMKADTVNYTTAEAAYGDLVKTQTSPGSEYRAKSTTMLYSGKTAVYVQMVSDRSGTVKAGDPIMEIAIIVDEVALAEKELKLTRMQEDWESGRASREQTIADMMEARNSAPDDYSYRKQTVQIQIRQVELEQYNYNTGKAIQALAEEIDELHADLEPHYIEATMDGSMSGVSYLHEGDIIRSGDAVCTITDTSVRMVRCQEAEYRYGNAVTVTSTRGAGKMSMTGKVVVSSAVIPGSAKTFSIIEIENPEKYTGNWSYLSTTTNELDIKNVLLIPNRAKGSMEVNTYATFLGEDNALHKRNITAFLSSQTHTWVLNGASEGDILVVE